MRLILIISPILLLFFACGKDKDCNANQCFNGGICIEGQCECPEGYTGQYCEISKCESVVCHNGGVCNDGSCICPDGFSGPDCSIVDNPDVEGALDYDDLFSHDYVFNIPRYVDFVVTRGSYYDEQVQVFTDGLSKLSIDNKKAALGRVLFYDPSLSSDNTISCASCHKQENAFSDIEKNSLGVHGGRSLRNSPGLTNSIFYPTLRGYAWDQANGKLVDQFLAAINHRFEMNMTVSALEHKLSNLSYYSELFQEVYGEDQITSERILESLKHFVCAMASYGSRYDKGRALLTSNGNGLLSSNPELNQVENQGRSLFLEHKCNSCHIEEIYRGETSANIGLALEYTDNGVGARIGDPEMNGYFKIPSLRNLTVTAPYMHDGRYESLEQVIRFYSDSVRAHPNLDPILKDDEGNPLRLNLSDEEVTAMVEFLHSLTDYEILEDPKFSNPFLE